MRLLVLALVLQAAGQEALPKQEPPRDPTEADARMRQALLQGRGAAPAPAFALRGLVVAKGKPGTAVLEIGEKLHRVTEGSTLSDGGAVWRVAVVTADELRLEAPATGQKLVLR